MSQLTRDQEDKLQRLLKHARGLNWRRRSVLAASVILGMTLTALLTGIIQEAITPILAATSAVGITTLGLMVAAFDYDEAGKVRRTVDQLVHQHNLCTDCAGHTDKPKEAPTMGFKATEKPPVTSARFWRR